ncbi:MAG: aldo/keto reductase [Treponema sp.]|nr:aldo/keto reductase [Treponema sp.]
MLYREYGATGKKMSILGFGGMRFGAIDDHDACVKMMVTAAEGGINYFDTAPEYFGIKSETVFGKGLAELRRRGLPYFCATKTFESAEDNIRRELDAQLKRLDVPAIDFYHIWCITSLENWRERKKGGVLSTFRKLKDEGLVKHVCISSHLLGDELNELLLDSEGIFEGVLFGYSAYNYKTREAAFKAVKDKKLGAVIMNPLGGGVIPQNPERFAFLKRGDEGIVPAALSFLWDHTDITVALVGFQTEAQVKETLDAVRAYKPRSGRELETLKAASPGSLEGICTGCAYCNDCPAGIPIPEFMDVYNQKLLDKEASASTIKNRVQWHWWIDGKKAKDCTACGQCEKACTQHINIIDRLRELSNTL